MTKSKTGPSFFWQGLIVLLIAVMCAPIASAQYAANPYQEPLRYSFTQFRDETWDFIQQPTTWNTRDFLTLGIIGAGTYLLIETADEPLRDVMLEDRRHFNSAPIELGRIWGELYTPALLFGGFAAHSLLADNLSSRKIAYEIGQSTLYAGAVTAILKLSFGRARPFMNEGTESFRPFSSLLLQDRQSLPSGHNTIGFAVSTVLSRNAGPLWLKVLAYLPAALTFVSRVYQDKHWVSDDFLGAAIGYLVASWVVDRHEGLSSTDVQTSLFPFSMRVTF